MNCHLRNVTNLFQIAGVGHEFILVFFHASDQNSLENVFYINGNKAIWFIYQTKKQIPEEVWQAWDRARFILEPPPFALSLSPRLGVGGGIKATKAGHGQQALMFILTDCSPCCLAFFCVCPGTTIPLPSPQNTTLLRHPLCLTPGQGMSCT